MNAARFSISIEGSGEAKEVGYLLENQALSPVDRCSSTDWEQGDFIKFVLLVVPSTYATNIDLLFSWGFSARRGPWRSQVLIRIRCCSCHRPGADVAGMLQVLYTLRYRLETRKLWRDSTLKSLAVTVRRSSESQPFSSSHDRQAGWLSYTSTKDEGMTRAALEKITTERIDTLPTRKRIDWKLETRFHFADRPTNKTVRVDSSFDRFGKMVADRQNHKNFDIVHGLEKKGKTTGAWDVVVKAPLFHNIRVLHPVCLDPSSTTPEKKNLKLHQGSAAPQTPPCVLP